MRGPFAARRTARTGGTPTDWTPLVQPLVDAVAAVARGVWRAVVWVAMLPVRLARALGSVPWATFAAMQNPRQSATA